MKKIILIVLVALFVNGCRYVNTTEPYLSAKESKELTIPKGVDTPNSTSTLEIPVAKNEKDITENSNPAPPDMPIRTKQSENGDLKISNEKGYPVLTVKTDKDSMWQAMNNLSMEEWSIASTDQSNCLVTLKYIDKAASEREKDGFLKKLFRRDKSYSDYSGMYNLSCTQLGSITQTKFSTADGSQARTFIADDVMTNLYGQFE